MAMSPTYTISRAAHIGAPADRIYSIIRDYRVGHPSILPKAFSNLRVEEGGVGAGTKIRFDATVFGRRRQYVGVVAEPEPGRVLVERYSEPDDSVTTFIVEPHDGGRSAMVTFVTEIPGRGGFADKIARWFANRVLQPIYAKELQNLADVATRV
jgi:polyketide cyclase/dehydrase/lipid transport protein